MDPGEKFSTRAGSSQFSCLFRSDWVSHLWFGFEFGKFPQKTSNFSIFFSSGQKNLFGTGQKVPEPKAVGPYLLRVKSKLVVSKSAGGSKQI